MNHFITKKRGKQIIAHFQDWFDQIQKDQHVSAY